MLCVRRVENIVLWETRRLDLSLRLQYLVQVCGDDDKAEVPSGLLSHVSGHDGQ